MLRPYRTFNIMPSLPPRLMPLRELAYNLWWTWNLDAVDLIRRLDRDLWESTHHNPVLMLGKISQDRLDEAEKDEGFQAHLLRIYQALNRYMSSNDTWFERSYGTQPPGLKIAYFSAEYGITECLPIYSGGLGVLAGDYLKSASDLGVPLVGVGLLYQQYSSQYLNADGWQQEAYPINDFYTMPIQLERGSDGAPATVQVAYPGRVVTAQIWRAQVGRVQLYLLDTNLGVNRAEDRAITSQLYGGDLDMRVRQEIMLGIGGMRALNTLGIKPLVCQMNEGHSAFMALERARQVMQEQGLTFAEASEATSAGNVFTTHTSVPAGIDLFPPSMMDHYFTDYSHELGLNREEFLRLGQSPYAASDSSFSMAILALHLAASSNGVSKIHGEVARELWKDLWPQTPVPEVPITSITNGIHLQSWISHDLDSLFLRYLGPRWAEKPWDQSIWMRVERTPDEELWRTHERRRERLVGVARDRLRRQMEARGATPKEVSGATEVLDPEVLTIGFARRFATYKRALLLFSDPERLLRIMNDHDKPVQIIFAGKAHPQDNPGKEFIRQITHFARREDMRRRVIFLEDYDLSLARYLVQGVDVWLNTPRPGKEASGTSGMKAAVNGVLNVSSYDGWWREGYRAGNGWCVGHGEFYEDERYADQVEAQALYDLLEKDVIPLFYERSSDGLPRGWIARMKQAMRTIAPVFNTQRMVIEYTDRLIVPAAARYRELVADSYHAARDLAAWLAKMRQNWHDVRILSMDSRAPSSLPVGTQVTVQATLSLGALMPQDISVQVFYGTVSAQGEIMDYDMAPMSPTGRDAQGNYVYDGTVRYSKSGLQGYAVRVLPCHAKLSDPHVPGLVLWSTQ